MRRNTPPVQLLVALALSASAVQASAAEDKLKDLDGAWAGNAMLEFEGQEYADCPVDVDFDVAIKGRTFDGAVRRDSYGGAVTGSVAPVGDKRGVVGTIVLKGWVEVPVPFKAAYTNGAFRGELELPGFCLWSVVLKRAK